MGEINNNVDTKFILILVLKVQCHILFILYFGFESIMIYIYIYVCLFELCFKVLDKNTLIFKSYDIMLSVETK